MFVIVALIVVVVGPFRHIFVEQLSVNLYHFRHIPRVSSHKIGRSCCNCDLIWKFRFSKARVKSVLQQLKACCWLNCKQR